MPEIDRRGFLQTGGMALLSVAFPASARAAVRSAAPPTLVCVFLRGGLDGLSMLVPHGDPLYYRARPRTAIPAADVIDLDGYFGLHPGLAPLKPFWDDGRLAVIPAAGSAERTRSHVDAQDHIVALLARSGAVSFASLHDVAHAIKTDVAPDLALVNAGGWDTHVNQGSSDGQLAGRLRALAVALAGFTEALGRRARSVVVLTMSEFGRTIRENGNSGTDHGHATAMLALGGPIAGGKVLGRWPGLGIEQRFEGRDVAVTTDCRDLFGELLVRHLGAADLAPVFPGFDPNPQRFPGAIHG